MTGSPPPLARFRAAYWFGGFNGLTWMIGLGTPMVLLLERLGASAFQVGLAGSFVLLLYPIQVVATALLPRFGFRRQMVLAWTSRALFLLVPLGFAWAAPASPAPWMANAVVISVFAFCFCRAFGVAAHIPWMAAILPGALRGRFFATDNAITSVVGVVTLLFCALLFAELPGYQAFAAVYCLAVVGSTMAVVNLLRLPAGPVPPASPIRHMLRDTATLTLRPGLFRRYLVVGLLWLVVSLPIPVFAAYYLKTETDVGSSEILAFEATRFIGQIASAWGIRHRLDRISIRRFFQLASLLAIVVCGIWLVAITRASPPVWLFWLAYLLFGVAIGSSQAAHFTYLPELAPPERQPVTIAIYGAVTGILGGLSPIVWGRVLRTGGATPGLDLERFAGFFLVGIGLSLLAIVWLQTLPDGRSGVSRPAPRVGNAGAAS